MTQRSSVERIREGQQALASGDAESTRIYADFVQLTNIKQPDMELFGCVDARLPIARLGAGHGSALLPRYPAAFVTIDEKSVRSAVEIAIKLKKVVDIVVMGHTDCGAVHTCLHQTPELPDTRDYLAPLLPAREKIVKKHGLSEEAARRLEEETVRQSLINLCKLPTVAAALASGQIKLHGWVLDLHHAMSNPPQPFLNELQLPKKLTPEGIAAAVFKPMAEVKKSILRG